MRNHTLKVRLADWEQEKLEAAAMLIGATPGGANVARFVREAALSSAHEVLIRHWYPTLDDLLEGMRADDERLGDLTDLPSYGGLDVVDTAEVWSWDAGRLIVGTCSSDFEIIDRGDWD